MPSSVASQGALTAEQVQRVLLDPVGAESAVLGGAPVVIDSSSPVRFPRLDGFSVPPTYTAQNALITESDPETSEVTAMPESLQGLKLIHRFSNELARQSVVDYSTAMSQGLAKRFASTLDAEFVAGGGLAGAGGRTTILGLTNQPGIQEVTVAGAIDLDDCQDANGLALNEGANPNRWLMRPETFTSLRKQKDGAQRYQMQPDPTSQTGFSLLGIPVAVTKSIPVTEGSTEAFLVDFSQVLVVRDLAAEVRLLDQTYAQFDQLALRVVSRWDAVPLNTPGVIVLRGLSV